MMIIHRNVCFRIMNNGKEQEKGEGEEGRKETSRKTKEKSKFPHSGQVPAVSLRSLLLLLLTHFIEITLLLFLLSSILCLFILLCTFSSVSLFYTLFYAIREIKYRKELICLILLICDYCLF